MTASPDPKIRTGVSQPKCHPVAANRKSLPWLPSYRCDAGSKSTTNSATRSKPSSPRPTTSCTGRMGPSRRACGALGRAGCAIRPGGDADTVAGAVGEDPADWGVGIVDDVAAGCQSRGQALLGLFAGDGYVDVHRVTQGLGRGRGPASRPSIRGQGGQRRCRRPTRRTRGPPARSRRRSHRAGPRWRVAPLGPGCGRPWLRVPGPPPRPLGPTPSAARNRCHPCSFMATSNREIVARLCALALDGRRLRHLCRASAVAARGRLYVARRATVASHPESSRKVPTKTKTTRVGRRLKSPS